MSEPASPAVIDLARWVGATGTVGDPREAAQLELRDARLAEARALLCCAENLLHDLLSQGQPESSAPFVAHELNLLADQLTCLPEAFEWYEQNPTLLRRAAVLCAGHEWAGLGGLRPSLRVRVSCADEAIAETAVRLARLHGSGPHRAIATTPALLELEAEEQLVNEGLQQRAVLAGAGSAFAAADAAFLPSLADFLR